MEERKRARRGEPMQRDRERERQNRERERGIERARIRYLVLDNLLRLDGIGRVEWAQLL